MELTRGFGRRESPDERDLEYLLQGVMAAPEKVTYRKRPWNMPRVLDQGKTGTCVGHAWRHWLEAAPKLHPAEYGLSAFEIYRRAVLLDVWPENDREAQLADHQLQEGTSVRAAAKAMKAAGYIGEYRWAFDASTIADFVQRTDGSPVVVGTNWYAGMSEPDQRGLVRITGRILGGHAYLVRWYDAPSAEFVCVNNWSADWGRAGQFRIRHEDMDRLIARERGEACCGVEARTRILGS